jgi:penicillin-binding protein 2
MASRIASGKRLVPRLVHRRHDEPAEPLGINPEHLAFVQAAMGAVVGPGGTAGSARIQIPGLAMGGKTGSAQVHHISAADRAAGRTSGTTGTWKLRDHGLFIAFAPVDQPRYAAGLIMEHAGHGTFAAGVARDAFTYLYDRQHALDTLAKMQPGWGGDIATRMTAERATWQAQLAAERAAEAAAAAPPEDISAVDNAAQPPPTAAASAVAPPPESDNAQETAPSPGGKAAQPGNTVGTID